MVQNYIKDLKVTTIFSCFYLIQPKKVVIKTIGVNKKDLVETIVDVPVATLNLA